VYGICFAEVKRSVVGSAAHHMTTVQQGCLEYVSVLFRQGVRVIPFNRRVSNFDNIVFRQKKNMLVVADAAKIKFLGTKGNLL
jgi:hypothetical protein